MAGCSWAAPPGSVLGGQRRPPPRCGAAPAVPAVRLQGCLWPWVLWGEQWDRGCPSPPAAPERWGPAPPRLAAPQALVNVKARQTSARPALLPPSPSAWGQQLPQDCFSSQSGICPSPAAKKSHRLGPCRGTANLPGRGSLPHTSWLPPTFLGFPRGASPPSSLCRGQARQKSPREMAAAALPRSCPSRRVLSHALAMGRIARFYVGKA